MTNAKSTKRALFTSALAVLMCVAMLIGTTFAWFTDTASTGVNKIQAGNLDIDVEYTLDGTNWAKLDEATDLFQKGLWEPGHTEVVGLKVKNAGNLALKYNISFNVVSDNVGVNKDNKEYRLSDYLKVKTYTMRAPLENPNDYTEVMNAFGMAFMSRDDMGIPYTDADFADLGALCSDMPLIPGTEDHLLLLKVYMPETVGNEANARSAEEAASIDFGINVAATQYNYERDSFDENYDKDADYPEVQPVTTAEDLNAALNSDDINGKTVKLYNDISTAAIQLNDKDVAFDLNGKTLDTTKLDVKNSTVVFKDSSALENGTLATSDSYGVINAVNSDVTVESGKFVSTYSKAGSSGYANVIQVRNSDLTINGGYFENTDAVGSYNYLIKVNSYSSSENTNVTINGGEFVSHRNYGYIVTGDSSAEVNVVINGGKFTTTGGNSYLTNVKGSVVVNDCTFVAEGSNSVFNIPKDSTVTVKGGSFSVNEKSYTDTSLAGLIFHRKTNGWTSVYGTLLVDPVNPVKVNQPTYSGFLAEGAVQSSKGTDGFYTISK